MYQICVRECSKTYSIAILQGNLIGFKIIEILTVAHGGNHNDTICTVEIKQL